jgi:hypothetical protein
VTAGVTAGVAGDASASGDTTVVVADTPEETDVHGALIPGLAADSGGGPDASATELAAAEAETPAAAAAGSDAGDPADAAAAGSLAGRRRRWPLAAVAAAVIVAAAVALAVELSPGSPPKVTGGPTPSVTVVASPTLKPTPSRTASAKPTRKPAAKATKKPVKHVVKKKHRPSPPATTAPAVAQTTPAAPQTTPAVTPTTPSPVQTTPAQTGPQTISSAAGASSVSCSQFGNVGSTSGGSRVSFSFVNDSSADVQLWYLSGSGAPVSEGPIPPGQTFAPAVATEQDWAVGNSASGCLGIFAITGGGEVTVS